MIENKTNQYLDQQSMNELENYVKNYKIFMDTCSILHPPVDKFWQHIIPLLELHKTYIIIPTRCIQELIKFTKEVDGKNKSLVDRAKNSLDIIDKLKKEKLIKIKGEETDNFADNVFQVVFTKFRLKYNLLLITQDKNLSLDILNLNKVKSSQGKKIDVKKINKYGFFSNPDIFINIVENKSGIPADKKFKLCKNSLPKVDKFLEINYLPHENDEVRISSGFIRLGREMGAGGEATVYEVGEYVAKIYKKEKISKNKYEKINLLITKGISCEGVCFPTEIIYNKQGEFVGYLMKKAKGFNLSKSVFAPKPVFQKRFPTWKKRDTVELCLTILNKIKYMHDRNIIIGDINPANILVVSPKEVYFVDTDSYQIEDYPCPVGTINFTAPEIQGNKSYSEYLRTVGNENFAIATLLFMIMLPGKPPYSQQGGEEPRKNIIKMDFSYPFGDHSNKKTPEGPWRYIWSHLTYDIKKAFYHTFRKDGQYASEDNRLSVYEWIKLFKEYLLLLDSGKFGQQDKMSESLFPTRFKKNAKFKYVSCKLCGEEVQEDRCTEGICDKCLYQGVEYNCKKCGKIITFTNYQKYIKKAKKHDYCIDCYNAGNEIATFLICSDCGKQFKLTKYEFDYYLKKGLHFPKRCESCRKIRQANRVLNEQRVNNVDYNDMHSESKESSSQGSGSWCFLTTVVCEYYGKKDDCYELNILRRYRDNWLKQQCDGEILIKEYYRIAPEIVRKIKESKYYASYCEILFYEYIMPCIQYIRKNEFEECKRKYIEMVYFAKKLS